MKSKYKIFILICVIVVIHSNLSAQNRVLDSLKLALKSAKHDTTRCNIYKSLAAQFYLEKPDSAIVLWKKAQSLAEKNLPNSGSLRDFYLKLIGNVLSNIGLIYYGQGDISKALDYHHKSLEIREVISDHLGIATSLINIGNIYYSQNDIPNALECYHKSIKFYEQISNKKGIAPSLINIGSIYQDQGDISKALEYYNKSLKISEEIGDKKVTAISINNIGMIYREQNDIPKALECYHKSLKIKEEIGDKKGIATSLINIGQIYSDFGNLKESYAYASKSMQLAKELGYPENIKKSAELLKQIFQKQNKYKEAFEMYVIEVKMRDSINNQETQKAAIKKQIQYTYEKQEEIAKTEHKKELEKQQAVAEEKNRRQNMVIGSVVIGLIMVIVFAGYVFKTLRLTRKQKALIELKNKETENQKKEIEEKQKEILDSIHYAKRIQMAQIPSEKRVAKMLEKRA